jgi:four helix bundle suffix protein
VSETRRTSKKTELKLTQVARASLEELKLDYEDFLRQHKLDQWDHENQLRQELINKRCQSADEVASWVVEVARRGGQWGHGGLDRHVTQSPPMSTKSTMSTLSIKVFPELSANAALVLIAVACSLLNRQVERLANDFEKEGGFTERLYKVRTAKRSNKIE